MCARFALAAGGSRPQRTLIALWAAPTRGLPKWSSSEVTDENKASLERRCGDCRACAFRASLGATSQSIGRKLDGYAGSQSRWAGSDAVQRRAHPPAVPSSATTELRRLSPPTHHHAHAHHVASTHHMLHAHGPKSGTDTTAQLNQAELARLQSGDFTPPPVPPGPEMAPPASDGMNRMPGGGRATSNPTGGR